MTDSIDILLVDDEQRNLDTLESILEDPSYRLLRADNADAALLLLLENDIAAIVLDIKMPGISGFELAQLIKGTKKFRQIPILFLTAYMIDDADIVAGYGAGGVDYLTKPLNPQILRHKVAVFAELFRKTRALADLNDQLEMRVRERTAALEASEAALRKAATQKDLFLATLAHELRNPLAPLRTGLDLLLRHPDRPAALAPTLAAMNRQLAHMVRLINDLLDVSRITHGTLELHKERVNLSTVVEHAIETARPSLVRRHQIAVVEGVEALEVTADPTRILQIVTNLVNNASTHAPEGGTIRVRLAQNGDAAEIVVSDEGIGIPRDEIDRIFEMFTTVRRADAPEASRLGIGLALSRRFAELHGGRLTAESEGEGKGARFTLNLPADLPFGEGPEEMYEAPASRRPRASKTLTIAVVEDNDDSADMMSEWLEHLGHNVKVARTGPDGLALIVGTRPDVVLCDLGLPGMDGVEVCRRVMEQMAAPPVMVALSGWGAESDQLRTSAAGFRHHLVKPVDLDRLARVLDSIGSRGPGAEGQLSR